MEYITWENMTPQEKRQYKKIVKFWNITAKILKTILFAISAPLILYLIYKTEMVIYFFTMPILLAMLLTPIDILEDNSNYILEQIEREETDNETK